MHNEQLKLAHLLARFIWLALQALVVAMYFSSHKDTALSKEVLVIGRTHIEYSFRNAIRFEIGNKIRLGGDVAEILVFCRNGFTCLSKVLARTHFANRYVDALFKVGIVRDLVIEALRRVDRLPQIRLREDVVDVANVADDIGHLEPVCEQGVASRTNL